MELSDEVTAGALSRLDQVLRTPYVGFNEPCTAISMQSL